MRISVARDLRRVQVRTTAIATLAVVVVLAIAGLALVNLYERELMRQVDARLIGAAERIGQLAAVAELAAGDSTTFPRMDTPEDLVQVVDADGSLDFSSTALQDEPVLWSPRDGEGEPRTRQTSSQGPIRVTAVPFQERWVVLGDSLQPVEDAVDSLRTAMLIGLPLLTIVLAMLLWAVVGRTLKPVAAAVEHEEQLIGDVSHEVRSPLAGLRVLLETEPADLREVELSRVEAIATLARLETITDQLLILTREEHRPSRRESRPVDLDEIVLHQVRTLAPRVDVQIAADAVGPGQVLGRESDLASLVDNLLANAARHAHSRVSVSLREDAGIVELAVDDDGPGIKPEDRARVFDRFTRLDEARSRDQGGAGLGLAIVRAIVDAHHGSAHVDDSRLGGARFVVRLPASTPGDASGSNPASASQVSPSLLG